MSDMSEDRSIISVAEIAISYHISAFLRHTYSFLLNTLNKNNKFRKRISGMVNGKKVVPFINATMEFL